MRTVTIISTAVVLAAAGFGCRKAGEVVSKKGPAAGGKEEAAFDAKVAEVEAYMKNHDLRNTSPDEMKRALAGFEKDFTGLGAAAGTDAALAARCRLAAESMSLYVASLRTPPSDPETMRLALDAQAKWERAKGKGGGGPAR